MIVTNLSGESEILTDYTQLTRKRRVNGDYSLSFLLPLTERNQYAFELVEEESVIEYDDVSYRIKGLVEQFRGKPVKSITAYHTFYDIIDEYRYTTLTIGFKSINEVLSFIFTDTDWTFSVIDTFPTIEFENFGNDNCLSLFQKVLDRYQAEFEIVGNNINIKSQIGSTIDFQFRFGHNVKTFKKTIDTSNLSTYIKGTGKQNEDGTFVVEAEYTSPNASVFGIRHAPPYSNETITNYDTLLNNLQAKIQDTPEMSIELEFVSLQFAGYPFDSPGLGDTVPTIYEPLKVDVDLRILEIEDYPETKKTPKVSLSTVPKSFVQSMMNYSKQLLDKIYDENSGKIRYNVYDDAVKRATEALNNSLTELEYPPNMGIVARDPNDPNRFVVLRSAGLGVTTDGGATFKNAITADGVVTELLTAGQIKTNNIQIIGNDNLFYWDGNYLIAIDAADANKFARLDSTGLYIAKGAMTIERPDGYKLINNGQANFDFAVQGHNPPYTEAPIETYYYFWRTKSYDWAACNFYSYRHTGRYLKVEMAVGVESGNKGWVRIMDRDNVNELWKLSHYNWIGDNGTLSNSGTSITATVDLGVPTGNLRSFYVQLSSDDTTKYSYVRVVRAWLEE